VQLAILRMRDGGRLPCRVPHDDATAREVGLCVHSPAQVPEGRILRLLTAENRLLEVKARDLIGIEMDPPYVLIKDFLSEPEAERAMAHALAHESEFRDSTVAHVDHQGGYSTDTKLRRSRILDNVADVAPIIGRRLHERMPHIFRALEMQPIPFKTMELQLSAHGDGDFFNTHTDNGLPEIAHRTMSYVYYFHREPKRFTGGHLRLFKTVIHEGTHSAGDLVADIDPPGNGLMVFPSYIHHEVTPIACPSPALADQRLTLNGWLVA
jgi:SM-20-related protein